MNVRFWKMSGAGNDFVVLPLGPDELPVEPSRFVRLVCPRGIGVGADGVLFVTPAGGGAHAPGPRERNAEGGARPDTASSGSAPDAVLVHYNADGGRSDFCGNGTRCAARFAVLMGFAGPSLRLATDSGLLRAEVRGESARIDVPAPTAPAPRTLAALGEDHRGWLVRAGVPHFVLRAADPDGVDVARLGAALRAHPGLGPGGANVDFVGPEREGRVRLRTYERGVEGETLACGSGAIATAAVLAAEGLSSPIVVTPASGLDLVVEFTRGAGGAEAYRLTGEARVVFEGSLAVDRGPA